MSDETMSIARAGPRLTVNLDALLANYRELVQRAQPDSVAAVVKANAYGLGMRTIASELAAVGCRHFFVATLEEGIALRALLADPTIYVMSPPPVLSVAALKTHQLLPCLYAVDQIRQLARAAHDAGLVVPVALHVDTGINRLGLTLAELANLDAARDLVGLRIERLMSHLASSDEPGNTQNQKQLEQFSRAKEIFSDIPTSFANSGGVFLGSEYHQGLSRAGVSLYGVDPHKQQRLRTVCTFDAPILQLRELKPGDRVGYGGSARIREATRVAVVQAGYADGVIRRLGEPVAAGACVGLRNQRAPFIGRISMDLSTVDVTAIRATEVGDRVEIFGSAINVDDQARYADTIAYELFTGVGERVERVYVRD